MLRALVAPPESRRVRVAEHALVCAAVAYGALSLVRLGPRRAWKRVAGTLLSGLTVIPGVSGLLDSALENELADIERELLGDGDPDARRCIPEVGLPAQVILTKMQEQKDKQIGYATGKKWGGIYHEDGDLTQLQAEAWALFNSSNLLYPDVFPGARKFEAELVAMVLHMLHGEAAEEGAVGLLSSGGTESILLAVLAYREQGRQRGIEEPEILAAISAHPALTKACHYFGVRLTKLPICPKTFQLRPEIAAAAITSNTVAIYSSAPTFTHGIVDPIQELGALALQHGLGLHVDNCLGGFLLSYLRRSGAFSRDFDFSVPGVTTISCDLHKYGNTSKGVSVIGFRSAELRRLTYVPSVDGCEGLYVTPTLQGSRAGGPVAQAWATLLNVGDAGYIKMAAAMDGVFRRIESIVADIPELQLLVKPDAAIVPMTTTSIASFTIYQVASLLETAGWNMFTGQHPAVMSCCIGEQHLHVLDDWERDLRAAVATLRKTPDLKLEGHAAVYGAAAAIPDELLDSILRSYVDIRMSVKDCNEDNQKLH